MTKRGHMATCHDYIERNDISTPHTKKKSLEESGRPLAKGTPTYRVVSTFLDPTI